MKVWLSGYTVAIDGRPAAVVLYFDNVGNEAWSTSMVVTLFVQNDAHARLLNLRAETCNATPHLRGAGVQKYFREIS